VNGAIPVSYDSCVRIERKANGFSVCLKDPKIVKQNANPKNTGWRDPEREYLFRTVEGVKKFLDDLDSMLPSPDDDKSFDANWDKAAKAAEKD
jgi:hypothetical protein